MRKAEEGFVLVFDMFVDGLSVDGIVIVLVQIQGFA